MYSHDKSFQCSEAEATNYSELQDAYANGVISRAKQKREIH